MNKRAKEQLQFFNNVYFELVSDNMFNAIKNFTLNERQKETQLAKENLFNYLNIEKI